MNDHKFALLCARVLGRGPGLLYFHIACLIRRDGGHRYDDRSWTFQSQDELAAALGFNRRYVQRCLDALIEDGWIDRHRLDYGKFAARFSYTVGKRDLVEADTKGKTAVTATDDGKSYATSRRISNATSRRTGNATSRRIDTRPHVAQVPSGNGAMRPDVAIDPIFAEAMRPHVAIAMRPHVAIEGRRHVATLTKNQENQPKTKKDQNSPPPEGHPPGLDEQPAVAGEPWPEVAAAVSPTAHGTPSEGKKTHSQEDLAAILERKRREMGLGAPERRLTPLAGTIPHKPPSEAPQSATEAPALKPAPPAPAERAPDSSFAAMAKRRRALESAELQQAIQAPPKPPQEPPPPPPAPPTPHRPPTARRRMRPVDLQPVPNLTPPKAPEPSASPPAAPVEIALAPVENSAPPDPPPQPAIETKPKKSGKIIKNYKPTDGDIPEALTFAGESILSFWSVKAGSNSSMAWNFLINNLQRMQQDGASRDDIVDLIDGAIQGGWSGLKMSYWHDRKARKQQTAQRLGQSPDPSADPKRRPSNWFNPAFR